MTDYALNDRGSLEIITDDFYDQEILRLLDGLRYDREQLFDGQARLVPEPDNPRFPQSIAVYVGELKIGRMSPEDSLRYWPAIARVVASGYDPVAPVRLRATIHRTYGQAHLESRATLSISRPALLFPLNGSPRHATVLPQGPSLKVLDEKEYAEYLHEVLPVSGEGRVILTLEANHLRLPDGSEVDSVDVLHERRVVGRLSTQMSAQLAPIIRSAFERDKLTAVWGTIRGNAFELSLTVQAVRAPEIPASWLRDLPNDVPALKPEAPEYELEDSYVPSHAEAHPESRRSPAPGQGIHGSRESSASAEQAAQRESEEQGGDELPARRHALIGRERLGWILAAIGLLVLLPGLVLIFLRPIWGILALLLGASLAFIGLYIARLQSDHQREWDQDWDDDLVDDEEQFDEDALEEREELEQEAEQDAWPEPRGSQEIGEQSAQPGREPSS